jgi:membrane fusion protein, heavy metal efflux system
VAIVPPTLNKRGVPMRYDRRNTIASASGAVGILVIATGAYFVGSSAGFPKIDLVAAAANTGVIDISSTRKSLRQIADDPFFAKGLELSDTQLKSIKVEAIGEHTFPIEKEAVGSIDFNQEMSVQVFTPYQGRIIETFAKVGEEVAEGATLFTIDSPDLLQASSTLIATAGVLELTTRNLTRSKTLYETRAIAQRDLEQATSDQQTAEGALKAARDAVRLFGKTDAEINRTIAERRVDRTLVVKSPISGTVTARNAAPGLFVQPGNAPAPYAVADMSIKWMLANVAETDSPYFHAGQQVKVRVMAFPGRLFEGRISTIGATVDPNTHRVLVRSEIKDPSFELRPGMFATFLINITDPVRATAVPSNGVVREGDGTMTVWVTNDRRHFLKRTIRIGLERDGYDQVLEGLQPGELIVADNALFLSNAIASVSR